jgi:hypothetical protein
VRQREAAQYGFQCLIDRMLGHLFRKCFGQIGAPPVERGLRHGGIGTVVGHVVQLAAESVQHGHRLPLRLRQETESRKETGFAFRRFQAAIFERLHGVSWVGLQKRGIL